MGPGGGEGGTEGFVARAAVRVAFEGVPGASWGSWQAVTPHEAPGT